MRKYILILTLSLYITSCANAGVVIAAGVDSIFFSSSATDLTSNWTVAYFNRVIRVGGDNANVTVWHRATADVNNVTCEQLQIWSFGNPSHIRVYTALAPVSGSGHLVLTSSGTISDNNYHHYAVTRSGNVWTLYIDGVQDNQVTDSRTQQTGCHFTLGNDDPGDTCANSGAPRSCVFAEAFGSASVANADQIKALSAGSSPWNVGILPVYYWPFYMGNTGVSAGHLPDLSGNNWFGNTSVSNNVIDHCACGMPTGEGK